MGYKYQLHNQELNTPIVPSNSHSASQHLNSNCQLDYNLASKYKNHQFDNQSSHELIEEKTHIYVFIRKDIPLSWQIVQSNHATFELGLKLSRKYAQPPSIVLIQIKDEKELLKAYEKIGSLGIHCEMFHEPYKQTGATSFATEPIFQNQRSLFSKYQLWKNPIQNI
jgi:hypothetical protein